MLQLQGAQSNREVCEKQNKGTPSDAGLLETTEGSGAVDDVVAVDPDGARADVVREVQCAGQVLSRVNAMEQARTGTPQQDLRDDARSEAVGGRVGAADDLVIVGELDDRHDGAEDLLLRNLRESVGKGS